MRRKKSFGKRESSEIALRKLEETDSASSIGAAFRSCHVLIAS